MLASWVTLAFMTLEEVGAARYGGVDGGAVPPAGDGSGTDAGMRAFARHTVTRFAGGAGARRLLTAQVLAAAGGETQLPVDGGGGGGGGGGRPTPSAAPGGDGGMAALMRSNARICVLTLDAARGCGVRLAIPLDRLEGLAAGEGAGEGEAEPPAPFGPPVGFAAGALPARPAPPGGPGGPPARLPAPVASRARAARLLLSFLGAAGMAAADPAAAFVATAAEGYLAGESARGVLCALRPDELASAGADAALPVLLAPASPGSPGGEGPGAALLRQWVSIVFMALALKGVPHPAGAGEGGGGVDGGGGGVDGAGAARKPPPPVGWAFAGDPATGAAEAYGLARVVAGALETDEEGGGGGGAAAKKSPAVLLASAAAARGRGLDLRAAASGAPPSSAAASSAAAAAPSFVVLEDGDLATSSAALGIMRQQVSLAVAAGALVDAKAGEWGLV